MKLIIVLTFLFVAATSAIDTRNQTLNQWYSEVESRLKSVQHGEPFFDYTREYNDYCVKNTHLNLNIDGHKKLSFPEAMILVYQAILSCKSFQKPEIWTVMVEALANHYKNTIDPNQIGCFILELKKIEPNSYLVYDFDFSSIAHYIETCKIAVDDDGFWEHIADLEQKFGIRKCGRFDM